MKKFHFSKIRSVISAVVFTIAMGVISLESSARAQTNTAVEDSNSFGTFSQLNSGVTYENPLNVGPQACVPTATANALGYLQNTFDITSLVSSNYDTVNTLASIMGTANYGKKHDDNGTFFYRQKIGLNTYLADQGVSSMVGIAATVRRPTVASLYKWLTDSNAVTIWINWRGTGTNGFHALTLYSISYTDVRGSISGSLAFLDPWNQPEDSTSVAANVIAATFHVADGIIKITNGYVGGAGGSTNDPDNPGKSSTGTIVNGLDIAFSPAPQPNFSWAAGAKGTWNTNDANWISSTGTSKVAFVAGTNAVFTNAAVVTLSDVGIRAGNVTVSNKKRTTSFRGGNLSAISLTLSGTGALVVNNSLILSNDIAVTSRGTLSLLTSNIASGASISGGGKVILGNNLALGAEALSLDGGILSPNKKATALRNAIVIGTGGAIITNAASFALSGRISGSGGLTKTGAGSLSLTGTNNNYSGGTLVRRGILAGNAASLQGNITNNASLVFDQSGSGTFTGSISGKGKLSNIGSGSVTLSGINSFRGGTSILLGNLAASSLGTGALILRPSEGAYASFTDTLGSGALNLGAIRLRGSSSVNLATPYGSMSSGKASVSITGTNNFINLSGAWTNLGIYSLISGKSITGSGLKEIDLSGSFLDGAMLALGESTNFDGYEYTFTKSKTALELKVSDAPVMALDTAFIQVQPSEAGSAPSGEVSVEVVPEPSDYTLVGVGLGLGALLVIGRRRSVS